MIDLFSLKAVEAMGSGVAAICATCELYWRARDQGVPDYRCLAVDGCCGPIGGGDFHEYKGPITDFLRVCFVCGVKPSYGIRPDRSVRVFGACLEHFSLFRKMRPCGGKKILPPRVVDSSGYEMDSVLLQPYRKKTLGQAIYEVEKYYADKEGRDL